MNRQVSRRCPQRHHRSVENAVKFASCAPWKLHVNQKQWRNMPRKHGSEHLQMSRVPSPSEQPVIDLKNWTIFELEDGLRFFMGEEDGQDDSIRTSTPILELDETTMTGVTASGRLYNLVGEPRPDPLEDISVQIVASIIGVDLRYVSVIEMNRPTHPFH